MADTTSRPAAGQSVAVILNPIRPEKRELFEQLIERLRPLVEEQFPELIDSVRFLAPMEADEDGTLTYVFLFDPFRLDVDYTVDNVVTTAFDEQEAAAFLEEWGECFAGPQIVHRLQQT